MAVTDFNDLTNTLTVTIASGQTVSGAAFMAGCRLVGLIFPASLTGTTFTFQAGADGVAYSALYNTSGAILTTVVGPSRYVVFNASDFAGIAYLKLVSNASEGADRIVTLVTRPL